MDTELLQITQEEAARLIGQISRKMRGRGSDKMLEKEVGSLLYLLLAILHSDDIDEHEVMLSMFEKQVRTRRELENPPTVDLTQLGF